MDDEVETVITNHTSDVANLEDVEDDYGENVTSDREGELNRLSSSCSLITEGGDESANSSGDEDDQNDDEDAADQLHEAILERLQRTVEARLRARE